MATDQKKPTDKTSDERRPQSKKSAKKKVAAATAGGPVARKAAPAPAPEAPPRKAVEPQAAPVRINAVKPEEKLAEPALVERTVDTFEKSLKAAVPAAVAVNCKLVDIAQANMNSGLELARDLASAKSPLEAMRLGMTYWSEHADLFRAQAQELRALQAAFVATASAPIREHMRRT